MEEEVGERKQKDQLACLSQWICNEKLCLEQQQKRHLQWVQKVLVVPVVHYYLADPEEAEVKELQYIKY